MRQIVYLTLPKSSCEAASIVNFTKESHEAASIVNFTEEFL